MVWHKLSSRFCTGQNWPLCWFCHKDLATLFPVTSIMRTWGENSYGIRLQQEDITQSQISNGWIQCKKKRDWKVFHTRNDLFSLVPLKFVTFCFYQYTIFSTSAKHKIFVIFGRLSYFLLFPLHRKCALKQVDESLCITRIKLNQNGIRAEGDRYGSFYGTVFIE